MKKNRHRSEAEHGSRSILRWSKRAFIVSLFVSISLIIFTLIIFDAWQLQNVRHAKEHARTELQNVRSNFYLLLGNQQMFTSLIAQLMEDQISQGRELNLASFEPFFAFLFEHHPSFITATLARGDVVVDQYPDSAIHSVGYHLENIPEYFEVLKILNREEKVILDGPLHIENGPSFLVSRAGLFDGDGSFWGLLTLHFNLEDFLFETDWNKSSLFYHYYFEFTHLSGDEIFSWGDERIKEEDPLILPVQFSLLTWKIFIAPLGSWHSHIGIPYIYLIFGVLVSLLIGLYTYLRHINFQMLALHSHTDSLTGLLNRREFIHRLEKAIQKQSVFAIAILDIDNFKAINDTFGHLNGDKALLALVHRIRSSVRMSDEVGRFGGDEFIVLMDESRNDQRFRYMHAAINRTIFEIESEKVFIHLSMGIALYPKDGMSSLELLEVADRRLYRAKLQGKGRACSDG